MDTAHKKDMEISACSYFFALHLTWAKAGTCHETSETW